MSLRVLTTVLTSPELLREQAKALQRHVTEDYRLFVVNDAYDFAHFSNIWQEGMVEKLRTVAQEVGARHWRFPQKWHDQREKIFPNEPKEFRDHNNANSRCADAIQYGVNKLLRESDDPLLILDADMIPVHSFDPSEFLSESPIWGIPENKGHGINYLWNGIILIDPKRANRMDLFNLDCGQIYRVPVDVGGMLFSFLAENEGKIGYWWRITWKERFELCAGSFAHLRGGGNWQLYESDEANRRIESFIQACQ